MYRFFPLVAAAAFVAFLVVWTVSGIALIASGFPPLLALGAMAVGDLMAMIVTGLAISAWLRKQIEKRGHRPPQDEPPPDDEDFE